MCKTDYAFSVFFLQSATAVQLFAVQSLTDWYCYCCCCWSFTVTLLCLPLRNEQVCHIYFHRARRRMKCSIFSFSFFSVQDSTVSRGKRLQRWRQSTFCIKYDVDVSCRA